MNACLARAARIYFMKADLTGRKYSVSTANPVEGAHLVFPYGEQFLLIAYIKFFAYVLGASKKPDTEILTKSI